MISNRQREHLNMLKSYFQSKIDFHNEVLKECICSCTSFHNKNKIMEYKEQLTHIEMIFKEEDNDSL